jgi:hypothetical protein
LASGTLIRKHMYDRKVYFLDHLRALRGEKRCAISKQNLHRLRVACEHISKEQWRTHGGNTMIPVLKKLKLSKYTTSRTWLGYKINRHCFYSKIQKQDQDRLVYLFQVAERHYKPVREFVDPTRKIFMSYAYIIRALSLLIGKPYISDMVRLPKNQKSRYINGRLWRALCARIGWKWITVY